MTTKDPIELRRDVTQVMLWIMGALLAVLIAVLTSGLVYISKVAAQSTENGTQIAVLQSQGMATQATLNDIKTEMRELRIVQQEVRDKYVYGRMPGSGSSGGSGR